MNSIQASQIMGGNGAKARKASDLYPTPPEVTVALMRFPSCQRGRMYGNRPAGKGIWCERWQTAGWMSTARISATG